MSTAIHWFRRDLRLTDNTALNAAAKAHERVVPVYVLSSWKGRHRWTGAPRQQFLCDSLGSLNTGLVQAGSQLLVRQGDPVAELLRLARESGATAIYANRDPDPHGRAVEERLKAAALKQGIDVHLFKDATLHEGAEVLSGTGNPFRVFTPYSKAWAKLPKALPGGTLSRLDSPTGLASLPLPTLETWGIAPENLALPEAGESAAQKRLERFLGGPVLRYASRRDLPAEDGTSRISQDLRFGLLSIRHVFSKVQDCLKRAPTAAQAEVQIYINELCWREFYFQVLWHSPFVLEWEYQPAYRGLPWRDDADAFQKWCEGRTGFPIVDAGMRELLHTGFMHNRVRMITAMFLTKDLHLDWRVGEQWFMQRLLDGEIASNNGGWQWSAGTGTDAAPYFRIQNPWSQGARFDPAGDYIRRWVPELRNVPAEMLHRPPAPGLKLAAAYPLPMLDHAAERATCMELYKTHLAKSKAGTPAL